MNKVQRNDKTISQNIENDINKINSNLFSNADINPVNFNDESNK